MTMVQKLDCFRYFCNDKYQLLQLPYEDDVFSMFVVLPVDRFGLSALFEDINFPQVTDLMGESDLLHGKVVMPLFEVESTFNLAESMKCLKIRDVFDPVKSNLGGLSPNKNIFVSDILHKSVIKVNQTNILRNSFVYLIYF